MRLIPLAGFDADTLMPLSPSQLARREQIAAEMARVAKASEVNEPPEMRRQVIDLRELGAACTECAVACLVAAPVSCAMVVWLALA
jgi:hypothetical protein